MPVAKRQTASFERASGAGPVSKGGTSFTYDKSKIDSEKLLNLNIYKSSVPFQKKSFLFKFS